MFYSLPRRFISPAWKLFEKRFVNNLKFLSNWAIFVTISFYAVTTGIIEGVNQTIVLI